MPRSGLMPRKAGSIIEKPNGNSWVAFTEPSSATSSTVTLPLSTFVTRELVNHFMYLSRMRAFEQTLGVADAVEPEMADIGFGRHEGYRHLIPNLSPAQLGVENEGEFIGRTEAGGALHGAGDDRLGVLAEFLETHRGLSA